MNCPSAAEEDERKPLLRLSRTNTTFELHLLLLCIEKRNSGAFACHNFFLRGVLGLQTRNKGIAFSCFDNICKIETFVYLAFAPLLECLRWNVGVT
jgi:hypothetical protein